MIHRLLACSLAFAALFTSFSPASGQAKSTPESSNAPQSGAKESVSLNELGFKTAGTFVISLKPGQTVDKKIPSLGGKPQANAFGTVGYCILSYQLKGQAERISGMVGIDDGVAKKFTEWVEVIAYGDNKKLWASGPLKSGGQPAPISINLKGVKLLELVADFSGDQMAISQVTWADMAISYSGFRPLPVSASKTPFQDEAFMTPKGPETPRITGGRVFGVRPGSPFLFTVTASGKKPMSFSAKNLPQGLQLNAVTGQITGCLRTAGEHRVLLSARNELGTAERELKIVVGDRLSLSPPMGWSSWNALLKEVDQSKVSAAF